MGLFDKKICDICGDKIGLLGSRKLSDGVICKNCANKLSPFFSERKQSTLEEINQQLQYREQNKQRLSCFNPNVSVGKGMKVYVDQAAGAFIATRATDWRNANPDIIELSQVMNCDVNIREHKTELYMTSADGKKISYTPKRYDMSYEFDVKITVNSPWFSEINFELSANDRPKNVNSLQYSEYQRQGQYLQSLLMPNAYNTGMNQPYGMNQQFGMNQPYMQNGYQQGMNMPYQNGMNQQVPNGYGQAMPYQNGMGQNGMNQPYGMNGQQYQQSMNQPYMQNGMNQQYAQNMQYGQNGFNQNMPYQNGMNQQFQNGYQQNMNMQYGQNGMNGQPYQQNMNQQSMNQQYAAGAVMAAQSGAWICPACGMSNTANFCEGCGTKRPM